MKLGPIIRIVLSEHYSLIGNSHYWGIISNEGL